MATLNCFGSKDKTEESYQSPTNQPAEKGVLEPFSRKLIVDEKLKLSNEKFKQKIYDFFKHKTITPLSQLTAKPPFPTPHVLAQFASKAYRDQKARRTDAECETRLALPDGWELLTTASNDSKTNGYFGAAYWHPEHQQVVIAHRGTKFKSLVALWTELEGVQCNKHILQMESAITFAHKVAEVFREANQEKGTNFQLFFTGHSLGGWLAQVTTFTTEYLKRKGNKFLKNYNDQDCFHPHTVVFDSPGCKDMLLQMTGILYEQNDGRSIDIEHLDITSYLSAPNRVNTCNAHVGTVYRIFPDLSDMRWWKKSTKLYNLATHSMGNIVQAFNPETGQVYTDERGELKLQVVVDWPISASLRRREDYKKFFEWAEHLNSYHPDITDISFNSSPIRYQIKIYEERQKRLSVFSQEEKEFLQCYFTLRQCPKSFKPKELFSVVKDNQAQEEAEKILQSFGIEKDTIIFTEPIAMQVLVPYVKRLLQLFPEIKAIANWFFQCETSSCIEQLKQSPLDFSPYVLDVREFLDDEQLQVLHVKMVDGDEWAGLNIIYQVLQKNNRLMESQYTVLKIERLLSLNMLMFFRTLMQSIKAPYLVLVACEGNQLLKAETIDMMRKIFENMKQKPFVKIILTTRSEGRAAHFLQDIGREIFGNGFVTRDEELTWSDLTSTSQEKLLEKSVIFQGASISLNELMSTESPIANFLPLGALLEEKELIIADPVLISNGYNESYYIGRTLRQQKVIKKDISIDTNVKGKHVFLASSEQEFKQLCQLYPNNNVHWLEKDKSGKLVWEQSQGSLGTVRRYIDTDSSHVYEADDLDKLLEQAQHQRVTLVSDSAGMGKSTVLTHLSKKIKQKFQNKWVVRIDLNDHTDALNVLKKEQIDKEKAIEFVSKKLLKLKPGLEMELFKQCCVQKHKVKVTIMLDGFDEISPFYKETVIGLLQALRQTAVEQLWVTTRPHLREELEDELQQLCFTLEPFSEENQIEFLTKFWGLKDWFTEINSKEKEKNKRALKAFAEKLIKILSQSISDKERQFTDIPLQTRMLAEAFDREVQIFCMSGESITDLPFKLDLLELYRSFIDRKYDIYQVEKCKVAFTNVGVIMRQERYFKIMRLDHQLLALNLLFTGEQVALFQNNRELSFSAEELGRIGIVQLRNDGKLHFVNRTFSEYYVADYLVNVFTEGSHTSEQVLTFILKDIFFKKDYRVVRVFIDGLLLWSKPSEQVLKEYGNRIRGLCKDPQLGDDDDDDDDEDDDNDNDDDDDEDDNDNNNDSMLCNIYGDSKTLLHIAVHEGNANTIGFLLDCAQAAEDTDTVNMLLLAKDKKRRTAWHNAVFSHNIQVLENLWECAKKNLSKVEINEKLLLATAKNGSTVWHLAARWGNRQTLQKLWDYAKQNLTTEEIINKLLLATDIEGKTAWYWAAEKGNIETLQKLWAYAKQNLTTEEIINKLLLATDNEGRTVGHMAAERGNIHTLQKLWEFAKERLKTEDINKLLLATDIMGRTVWHIAARWGNIETLQKLWDCATEKLTTEEINHKMLLATDNNGWTAWHLAAGSGNRETLQKLWDCAKENLTKEEINRLSLATDNMGRTAWHIAAGWDNIETLQKLWECAKEILTTEEINKLLLATDIMERTAWHIAARGVYIEILQILWECAKENLTTDVINNKLLLATDNQGRTVWHLAARWGCTETLQKLWECVKKNLTTEEINHKMLLATDNNGWTAWHLAAGGGNRETLQKLWDCAKKNLTTDEINNELLLATDNQGLTAWHLAASLGHTVILQKLWERAKENLTTEEINNKLLLATDNQGMSVWHLAARLGYTELLQILWECAKENLTREEINNKLLLATDNN